MGLRDELFGEEKRHVKNAGRAFFGGVMGAVIPAATFGAPLLVGHSIPVPEIPFTTIQNQTEAFAADLAIISVPALIIALFLSSRSLRKARKFSDAQIGKNWWE